MSEINSFACDVCGVQKKEANHWFRAYYWNGVLVIAPWDCQTIRSASAAEFLPDKDSAHLCGEGHALEWASKILSKGKDE